MHDKTGVSATLSLRRRRRANQYALTSGGVVKNMVVISGGVGLQLKLGKQNAKSILCFPIKGKGFDLFLLHPPFSFSILLTHTQQRVLFKHNELLNIFY